MSDLPRLVELLSDGSGTWPVDACDCTTLTEGVKSALEQPALGCIFVVREQGRIIAMALFLTTISTAEGGRVAMLDDFFVDPSHRNQGVGSRLLDALLRHAASQKLSRITVMPAGLSDSVRSFFEKHGFVGSEMSAMYLSVPVA